jgi:NADH-quinone oxidoreductase subunit L
MYSAAIFLPLIASIIAGLFGRFLGDRGSQIVTCGALLISAVLAVPIFYQVAVLGQPRDIQVMNWITSGAFDISWALRFDTLSAVMLCVVTWVSAAVHVYSIGYMSHDHSIPRFFSYLSLFTFFMLMLVTANNFVQLFFGWEGVGLASYLLIGFWYDKPEANAAAIKAFIVNRVGDFGFSLGIMATFFLFNSVMFDQVFAAVPGQTGVTLHFLGWDVPAMDLICILLFIGAMGKSAQIGLHTWLPDAMEGPTPVSALIHAATMVTAGVFMVCRLSPMFEYSDTALMVVTVIGATTAIFAASVGMVQNDIKRVIAYSTCSQLGYMFFAAGVSAYPAAMFHLMTHAFFKALLFLSAGSVIHAMSGEQDMRKMGGIYKFIPYTYLLMWIGSLALGGLPPFAGYFSKDIVIESAYASNTAWGTYAFWIGVIAAFMTAFYSWRLLVMTFHGKSRADEKVLHHVHESPRSMLIPMTFLAIGAVVAGWLAYDWFVGEHLAQFWGKSILILDHHHALHEAHHVPAWVKFAPLVAGLIGIALAYGLYMFNPGVPGRIADTFRAIYLFLLNKWYFDKLYDRIFVEMAQRIGRGLWKGGDGAVIDGLGPDGLAASTIRLARRASQLQTGYIYHYAFAMLIGIAGFVSWYLFLRAG